MTLRRASRARFSGREAEVPWLRPLLAAVAIPDEHSTDDDSPTMTADETARWDAMALADRAVPTVPHTVLDARLPDGCRFTIVEYVRATPGRIDITLVECIYVDRHGTLLDRYRIYGSQYIYWALPLLRSLSAQTDAGAIPSIGTDAWSTALRTHGVEATVVARIRMSLSEVKPVVIDQLDPAVLPPLRLSCDTDVRIA